MRRRVHSRAAETDAQFRKKQAMSRESLLRDALRAFSASTEAYLTTRDHFARTAGTLSICQYILGIGDRHLSNFMIDTVRSVPRGVKLAVTCLQRRAGGDRLWPRVWQRHAVSWDPGADAVPHDQVRQPVCARCVSIDADSSRAC